MGTDPVAADLAATLRATPLARREAALRGLDLGALRGSGPNGRIVSADLPPPVSAETRTPIGMRAPAVERGPTPARDADGVHRRWFVAATGRPVVLLHGFGADGTNWRPVLGRLPQLRMLVLDLPGHGRSTAPASVSLEMVTGAVAMAIEREELDEVHLVGHSLGGAIAMSLAERVAIRSLTLLAPAGLGPEIDGALLRGFNRAERKDSLAPWLRRLFADPSALTAHFIRATLRARSNPTLRRWQLALTAALFPDGTQAVSLRHVLDGLAVPTKLVCGTADTIVPAAHATDLPGRVGLHLVSTGHLPHLEDPALVATLIAEAVRAGS